MDPLFLIDFYKVGHVQQYPEGTRHIWSNWTPRYTHKPEIHRVVHFGLQYFIKRYLMEEFTNNFFKADWLYIVDEYRKLIRETLGVKDPKTDHIRQLYTRGYLPLKIYSVPEGTEVPYNYPMMVVTNTEPEFFWLVNYIESIMSNILWLPSTSATIAKFYRKIFVEAAKDYGHDDLGFVDWQGHDFSFRGMSGVEAAQLSGMGHLLSFSGTDTIPAILAAKDYYFAGYNIGGSVPATEHSVMCAGSKEGEFETFKRLITEVYPSGIVSIVSDTWDLWRVLDTYLPALRSEIYSREGKVVIRPDSGDPVQVSLKSLSILKDKFGVDNQGMVAHGKIGLIYGDSITPVRAKSITESMVRDLHISPYNMVFGIGSFTYQFNTRDTFGFAMKATAVDKGSGVEAIFKAPITDNGNKTSHIGIPTVFTDGHGEWQLQQNCNPDKLDCCSYVKVFENGELLVDESFGTIRKRVREEN